MVGGCLLRLRFGVMKRRSSAFPNLWLWLGKGLQLQLQASSAQAGRTWACVPASHASPHALSMALALSPVPHPTRVHQRPRLFPPRRYHVHEKAILMVTVPLGLLAIAGLLPSSAAAGDFLFLNTGAWWWGVLHAQAGGGNTLTGAAHACNKRVEYTPLWHN